MKRTISEIIDLIKQKKENAINEQQKNLKKKNINLIKENAILTGEVVAYIDILVLLGSSHLIEQEKTIEILKEHITCKKYNVSTEPDIDEYEYYIVPKNPATRLELTKENYDLLNEVLKDNE